MPGVCLVGEARECGALMLGGVACLPEVGQHEYGRQALPNLSGGPGLAGWLAGWLPGGGVMECGAGGAGIGTCSVARDVCYFRGTERACDG